MMPLFSCSKYIFKNSIYIIGIAMDDVIAGQFELVFCSQYKEICGVLKNRSNHDGFVLGVEFERDTFVGRFGAMAHHLMDFLFIAIGKALKQSPPFPPLKTVHDSFPSHGLPSKLA
jgi:hypothetical protein